MTKPWATAVCPRCDYRMKVRSGSTTWHVCPKKPKTGSKYVQLKEQAE